MSQPLPLVGRDVAVAELRQALDRAEARRGQLVLVVGEPGIGKSALADLVGREASARGAAVVFGRAWELAEAPPYFPVWPCLRALGIEPPQGISIEADAFHLWERVLQELGRASAGRPVVWILEDLHAADHLTLDLLTFLARPLQALGVLLLVTLRDRDPRIGERTAARLARLCRDGREIRLDRLTPAQVRVLAEAVAGHPLSAGADRQLAELSGGNPLFVIECARVYRGSAPVQLPPSVFALTRERVALLDEATREVLACGAVVGRDFSAAIVARMVGGLPAQVIERLGAALRAGIVDELRPAQYRFSHILVRDAVEESLSAERRADLHDRAERALASAGDTVDVLVERARHALAALRPDGDALALRAARALEALGAHDRALALYERIEDARAAGLSALRPDGGEELHRAAVARAAGRHGEARRRCQAVLAEARAHRDGPLLARAALELGAELRPATVDAELVAALREALLLAPADPLLCCRLEARLAAALQPAPDPQQPAAMARAAIARARALGDPTVLLEVLHVAGAALVDYAPLDERLALGEELRQRATAAGETAGALAANARLALDHSAAGDFAAFDVDVDRLRAISVELGHPRRRWRALLLESMRAIACGDFEQSDRCVVEVQQHASLSDDPSLGIALPAHIANRAVLFHRDDEVRESLTHIDELVQPAREGPLIGACIRIGVLTRLEDSAGAARELARVRSRLPTMVADLRHMIGEAFALVGTRDEQLAERARLLPLARRHLVGGHVAMTYEGPVLRLLGLLDASLGDHDDAIDRLTEAREGARARGHHLWVAQLSSDLGRALTSAGRPAEAARAFAEALAEAGRLGMPGLVARTRARLEQAPASTAAAPAPQRLALVREADVWRVDWGGRSVRVRHSRGLELLARLVERTGEEIHVLALASDSGGSLVEGDAGEALDPQARREYRARLDELDDDLAEAGRSNDLGRQDRLNREREAIVAELGRAVGLRGRARPAASASERARVNVQRRLKDAVARIAEADPDLGAFCGGAVHTGTYCCFRP